jgi:hypothetical protein
MHVIQRISDGHYVRHTDPNETNPNVGSYTPFLQYARVWPTYIAAQRECCPENERVVSMADIFTRALKAREPR